MPLAPTNVYEALLDAEMDVFCTGAELSRERSAYETEAEFQAEVDEITAASAALWSVIDQIAQLGGRDYRDWIGGRREVGMEIG